MKISVFPIGQIEHLFKKEKIMHNIIHCSLENKLKIQFKNSTFQEVEL